MTGMRRKACGYDQCERPGYCDGRHCAAAGGAVRLDPEEASALTRSAELRAAIAVLTAPAEAPETETFAIPVGEARTALALLIARILERDPHALATGA